MAEAFDGMRFSGPIGRLVAESQERVILDFLEPVRGLRVLDVGTGTGRGALVLASRGAEVIGVDASAEMLAVAKRRAAAARLDITFVEGDAHRLAYEDRSFEIVMCLRVLMHTPDWRQSLAELCRVSRNRVVLDYPALVSAAALQSAARRMANMAGGHTEAYRVFADRAVRATLRTHGFEIQRSNRQFVMPIALHKRMGSAGFSRAVEGALRKTGLNWLLGSPVTVLAERCAS